MDPDIGHMAKALLEGSMEFGHLHINSDNLARKYTHGLSNGFLTDVIQGRNQLVSQIRNVLSRFLDEWPST